LQNIWKIHVGKVFEYPTQGPNPLELELKLRELFRHESCEGSEVKKECATNLLGKLVMNVHEICFV
jgi:hypothetical protein